MKEIKVEWCRNWIRHAFKKLPFENGGIEVGCFWGMAEKSGLWVRGSYGSPRSHALSEMTKVEIVQDDSGKYLYSVFRLAKCLSSASKLDTVALNHPFRRRGRFAP